MNKKQMEVRLEALARELETYKQSSSASIPTKISAEEILRYFIADKQNTNALINAITQEVKSLRESVNETSFAGPAQGEYGEAPQIALSGVDTKILNFIQTQPQGMACADDVRKYMNYKGKNAACARLRILERAGLLTRYQMGHKVYYTGKATMQLIVSPPQ